MPKIYLLIVAFLTAFLLHSCSKKNHPAPLSRTPDEKNNSSAGEKE